MLQILNLIIFANQVSLLPYDAVEIAIWRQPDLSAKYYIDVDTTLNIPLIGEFSVKNIPLDSLQKLLNDEFRNYYGDIFLNIYFYYRINVFGEVKIPGYYYCKQGDNLGNILAQAGGPTEQANTNKIRILNLGKTRIVNFEKILRSGKKLEQLDLCSGDVVIIPRRFIPALQEWSVLFTIGTFFLQVYSTYLTATK